jgi:NADH-quinone oxidoreductase subunit M
MANNALILLIAFPVVGTVVAGLMRSGPLARSFALVASLMTFGAACVVASGVMSSPAEPLAWGHDKTWANIPDIGFGLKLAANGINVWLLLLTSLIAPLVVLSTGDEVTEQSNGQWFYAWILLLVAALNGTFLAADGLLFYFFFELTLVPAVLLIGIWGGPERREAAGKFFIYTFAGSIFLLISLIYLAAKANTFELASLIQTAQHDLSSRELFWIGLGTLVGFLIKTPIFPLNTWQPLAYAEAPSAATVLMAASMSKLGTYGLLTITIPIAFVAPAHNDGIRAAVVALCLISIVYGGLIAWVQKDAIRVMAYSSLSHLGLCVLAIFASTTLSLQGAVFYMLAHGLSTAALVLLIGMIARRTGTRNMDEMGGLFAKMPVMGVLLVGFTMASIGLPLTSGFVAEFVSLQGIMMKWGLGVTIVAASGVVLGAIYMLNLVARIGFGPLKAPDAANLTDLCPRETAALLPLAAAVIFVGVQPTPILDSFKDEVAATAKWTPKAASTDGPAQGEEGFFGQEP